MSESERGVGEKYNISKGWAKKDIKGLLHILLTSFVNLRSGKETFTLQSSGSTRVLMQRLNSIL